MFDNACDAPEDVDAASGSAPEFALIPAKVIGKIQTLLGAATITRAGGVVVAVRVGDPVGQGEVIETAADGRVGILFVDGTAFNLSGNARMVLSEFVCDADGASQSALFSVTQGTFAFIAGQVATGTSMAPISVMRNTSGNIKMLRLAN